MRESFDKALKFALKWESGKSDHPSDRGGKTCKGITQRVYDDWRVSNRCGKADVFGITDAECTGIYRDRYWRAASCDRLPVPVDLVVFDAAVNSGPEQSIKFLQRAVSAPADGRMGPVTLARLDESTMSVREVADACIDQRFAFYRRLVELDHTQAVFFKGWLRRLQDLRKEIA